MSLWIGIPAFLLLLLIWRILRVDRFLWHRWAVHGESEAIYRDYWPMVFRFWRKVG